MQIGPIKIRFGHEHKRRLCVVPHLGLITEQTAAAPKTSHVGHYHARIIMSFTMTDSQQVPLSVTFTDKKGNPATLPAGTPVPTWLVDNAALLAATAAADGLSCVVAAVGPEGSGTVSFKAADAAGNPIASGSIDATIVGGAPVNAVIAAGTPTEQP